MKLAFLCLLVGVVLFPFNAVAEVTEGQNSDPEVNGLRAKFNYQMFCQGCHTEDGSGHKSVPTLKGSMGNFLASQAGREYLVRVPGSANSTLNDEQLTEVLNWMLINFSENSLPATWQLFDVDEVTEYRKEPLFEVLGYRRQLLKTLALK